MSDSYRNERDSMNEYSYYQNPQQEKPKSNGFAIASMVMGIVALVGFCSCVNVPIAILAIIFGIIHLVQHGKNGMAIAGIVTAAVSIVLLVIMFLLYTFAVIDYSMSGPFNDYYDYYEYYEHDMPDELDTL